MKSTSVLLLVVMVGYGSALPSLKGWLRNTEELVLSMLQKPDAYENPAKIERTSLPIPKVAEAMGATEFLKYLTKANLRQQLEGPGPYTVFIPSNAVFESLCQYVKSLLNNQTALERIMKFNVVKGQIEPSSIKNNLLVPTLLGGDETMRMNIYRNRMVFTAAGRVIVATPRPASNGLVYEVEGLPQPPSTCIADSISRCPDFTNLTRAIRAAGMYDQLCGSGPFTIFAPTDAAFQRISEDTRERLFNNATAVRAFLEYLTVQGVYYTPAFANKTTIPTISGRSVTIEEENGKYMVNGAWISYPDTTTVNGVVQTIDGVLMPPNAHLEMVFMQR